MTLEQHITEVLENHISAVRSCPCGEWSDSGPGEKRVRHNYAEHIADALVAARRGGS